MIEPDKEIIDYYSKPGPMTFAGKYADLINTLPDDIVTLAQIVQGLVIHEYVASPYYGVVISEERSEESNIRNFEQLLNAIYAVDKSSLRKARPPKKRLVGVCHHFAKILVGFLRTKNIPARMRYGFGSYFNPGFFEDHSLCEYWNAEEARWVLVDPQFDDVWVKRLQIKHDVFDVPRDQFLVGGDAWINCRENGLDSSKFGIFQADMRGLWFIAGVLVKDIAALNKMEMLQWDAWGIMPRPKNKMRDKKRLLFFDQLAALTCNSDLNFKRILQVYEDKSMRLYVPDRVFNARHRHLEYIKHA